MKVRFRFSKTGKVRFVGHRDVALTRSRSDAIYPNNDGEVPGIMGWHSRT